MSRVLLLVAGWLGLIGSAVAGPKNVVLMIADDLGRTVGCYGDKLAKTPNIDALAAAGTRFPLAFASVASCSPSRATLLTGMPSHQNGMYGLAHATHNQHTFATVQGLPALLAGAGYRSGVVAKLHVQPKDVFPFDAVIADGGRNPVATTEKAKKFITESAGKPFFLLVGFTDPHRAAKGFANEAKYPPGVPDVPVDPAAITVPDHLPDVPAVRADLADYYRSVHRLDHGVGLMMKVLEDTGTAADTLVLFLSDNGIPFPGAKTTLYDAGVHLPLIVKKPGQAPGVCNAMASWTDIAPTILDWAGVAKPPAMPGRSVLGVLGQPDPTDWNVVYGSHQFHEVTMYYPMRMIRTRTHKLILNLADKLEYPFASDLWESPSWQAVRTDRLPQMGKRTTAAFLHRPRVELYDLRADPAEAMNLAADAQQAPIVAELQTQLAAWRKQTKDPWLVKDQHE